MCCFVVEWHVLNVFLRSHFFFLYRSNRQFSQTKKSNPSKFIDPNPTESGCCWYLGYMGCFFQGGVLFCCGMATYSHPQFPLFFLFLPIDEIKEKQKMISKLQQKTNDGELQLQQQKRSRASPSNWVHKLPNEMWTYHVLPCSTLKELSKLSRTGNSLFNEFWKSVVESCHHIRVVCGHVREGEGQTQIGISECLLPQLYCFTIERADLHQRSRSSFFVYAWKKKCSRNLLVLLVVMLPTGSCFYFYH